MRCNKRKQDHILKYDLQAERVFLHPALGITHKKNIDSKYNSWLIHPYVNFKKSAFKIFATASELHSLESILNYMSKREKRNLLLTN